MPVCAECAKALLYCFECCSSQWIYRGLARNRYRHHVLWLRGCPECGDAFGGLFFSDLKAVAGSPVFLLRDKLAVAA